MIKGAIGIVGLVAALWAVGCGTHSGIGNLGMGGDGGGDVGQGGRMVGMGGNGGDDMGMGGRTIGMGGDLGIGGEFVIGTGGAPACPGPTPPVGTAKRLSFAAPADYNTGAGAYAVTMGDLNGDGKLDLLLLDHPVGIRLMLNKGDGTFSGPADFGIGPIPYAVALGDLDGDGKIDIVGVSQSGVSVFLNKGNAVFSQPVSYVVGLGSGSPVLGDLNGDGKLDIAVTDNGDGSSLLGDVGILTNTGGGTFVAANYPAGRQPAAMAIGDMDNDCHPDLVLVGPSGVTVLENYLGQFPNATTFGNGTSGTSVAVADLNGDGRLDIVEGAGSDSFDGRTYVFINRGYASFNAPITYGLNGTSSGLYPSSGNSVALRDINGDGRPEILTLGSCCGLGVFANHGDGTFPSSMNFSTAAAPYWLAAGDLNGDGQPDVVLVSGIDVGATNGLRVLLNTSH